MNRLTTKPHSHAVSLTFEKPSGTLSQPRGVQLHEPAGDESPVASFLPLHYERNYAYPLVVWLHGEGQSELDLPQIMRHVSTRNYVAVAPRGETAVFGDQDGYAWRDNGDCCQEAEDRVFEAIAHAESRMSVHPDRVFIAGVGCGGTMAMRLAMSHPHIFAGAATFDGALPSGRRPLGRVNELRNLPLLLAGGRESAAYPEARLCDDLRLLHSAGATVSIRQYPGSDDLTTAMLADFDRWMMELVCGAPTRV